MMHSAVSIHEELTRSLGEAQQAVRVTAGSLLGGHEYEDLMVAVDTLVAAVRAEQAPERAQLRERAETAERNFRVAHQARVEAEALIA